MNRFLPAVVTAIVLLFSPWTMAEEPYEENYVETHNCARIFDWETLELLRVTKIKAVKISAGSVDELLPQLEKVLQGIKDAPKIRFVFPRELWEHADKDGTVSKTPISVALNVEAEDVPNLLTLLRWVSELGFMTFSVKKNEIIFRPLIG